MGGGRHRAEDHHEEKELTAGDHPKSAEGSSSSSTSSSFSLRFPFLPGINKKAAGPRTGVGELSRLEEADLRILGADPANITYVYIYIYIYTHKIHIHSQFGQRRRETDRKSVFAARI